MSAIGSYLRSHRLKSGFSRRELAEIAGLLTEMQVGRHGRSNQLPSLMAALSYQAIFRIPITELFPELYETIAQGIEERLSALEHILENSSARGNKANSIIEPYTFYGHFRAWLRKWCIDPETIDIGDSEAVQAQMSK
jgi:transcriptional regulator with XRE-family HTH domain